MGSGVHVHDVSVDGSLVVTSHRNTFTSNTVYPLHLWDAKTGKHLRTLEGHPTGILSARFSPDGSMLASGGMDNIFRLWNVQTGKQLGKDLPHNGHGYAVAFFQRWQTHGDRQ